MASPYALDFSPVTNALAGARKHQLALQEQEMDRQRLAISQAAAGREAQLFPYKKQQIELELSQARDAAKQQQRQRALAFIEANLGEGGSYDKLTPELKAKHWNSFLSSPLFDAEDKKMLDDPVYGPMWRDPNLGYRMLYGLASKYRDPLEKRKIEADIAKAGVTNLGPGERAVELNTGRVIAESPAKNELDATTKKAIDEADDFIMQNKGALNALKQALQLNKKAYDGALASGRAQVVNNTWSTDNAKATVLLENVITQQALQSLRSTFGGNPTEGERKILLDVAGSVNQPRAVREQIYRQAQAMAEARLRFNEQKAQSLRGGTYYKPGGQPEFRDMTPVPASPAKPTKAANPPIRDGTTATNPRTGQRIIYENGQWRPL